MRVKGEPTTPDLVVLSLLAEGPRHGYELNQELEWREVRDWAAISRPQVYYSLAKLARTGLVRPAEEHEEDEEAAERRTYAITPAGRAALRKALKKPEWAEQRPPPPFLTWMALAGHADAATVREQVARRRAFLEREAEREHRTLAEFKGHHVAEMLMVTLTIRQFEVELAWLDEVAQRLAPE